MNIWIIRVNCVLVSFQYQISTINLNAISFSVHLEY